LRILSLSATVALLALMRRAVHRFGGAPDFFLLEAVRDLDALHRGYLLCVALACTVAVARRRRDALFRIQLCALGAGLLLTQYSLGLEPGPKVDPRFVSALMSGCATLHACYLCALANLFVGVREANPKRMS
jgi:hypothetical protein